MSRRRLLVFALVLTSLSVSVARPAEADFIDVEQARAAIIALANDAVQEMTSIVTELEEEAASMATQAEVDAAAAQAEMDVKDIAQSTIVEINQIRSQFPGELSQDATNAVKQVKDSRQANLEEIANIVANYPVSVTTTTTTAPTTTTTTAPTTTTTTAPTTTTTTAPTTTTTTAPTTTTTTAPTTTTTTAPTTTTTTIAVVIGSDDGSSDQPEPFSDMAESLVPEIGKGGGGQADVAEKPMEMDFAGFRLTIPPALVDLVTTPFEILQLLLRTTLQGGRILLIPAAFLIGFAGLILFADRRRGRMQQEQRT